MKERAKLKLTAMNERYAEKYPKQHEKVAHYAKVFSDVWQETFPNSEKVAQDKMSARRQRAKMAREWEDKQKDMTPEEIAEMEESIPEWKRNAVVIVSTDEEEEQAQRGVFGRMRSRVADSINETEAAQNFYKSEEYAKVEEYRKEYRDFKTEFREQVDASHSPLVQGTSQLFDKVSSDSPVAAAVSQIYETSN